MDEMDDINSDEENYTPPDIVEAAKITSVDLLPKKSRNLYEKGYKAFMDWRDRKKTTSFSENVLLAYFGELAEKYKSSSLWTQYSMLRTTLEVRQNINIATYGKLKTFLERKSDGYKAKKSKTFTPDEINMFIENADDKKYLATKVALILGVMGACRCHELRNMNIEVFNTSMLITVPNTKTKVVRKFTVTGKFCEMVKKYIDLRPPTVASPSLFLNYQNGKCSVQNIGINKFSAMGKQIANYLNMPNPEMYTGHSFRRSSATILVDAGANMTALKRHGGWKSATVAEGYINDSLNNKMTTAQKILHSIQSKSTITTTETITKVNENQKMDVATASLTIQNCQNFTINIHQHNPLIDK